MEKKLHVFFTIVIYFYIVCFFVCKIMNWKLKFQNLWFEIFGLKNCVSVLEFNDIFAESDSELESHHIKNNEIHSSKINIPYFLLIPILNRTVIIFFIA